MSQQQAQNNSSSCWQVFKIFLRLGLTSFGGPIAHLAYFREEFVNQRQWLSDKNYADLIALCQFLPGPASSQVGIALGLMRSGYSGAIAAWCGFTLPSAIALLLFGLGLVHFSQQIPTGILQGLKIAAVAIVAQAVWGMSKSFCTSSTRIAVMVFAACIVLYLPSVWAQIATLIIAGVAGKLFIKPQAMPTDEPELFHGNSKVAIIWLVLFFGLLGGLPLLAYWQPTNAVMSLVDIFYRAGSLVFGGGHVVLPLLQAELVPQGWINNEMFLAGYGAAQAVPGPLFTFAAFLGTTVESLNFGILGAVICLVAIFLPSFFLIFGTLPFWERIRKIPSLQASLAAINAAVVGILLAALYNPIWVSTIHRPSDFALLIIAFSCLAFWKCPPWAIVTGTALGSYLVTFLPIP